MTPAGPLGIASNAEPGSALVHLRSSHHGNHLMRLAVIGQGDGRALEDMAVERDAADAVLDTVGVVDDDPVGRRAVAVGDLELGPGGGECAGRGRAGRPRGGSPGASPGRRGRARRPSRCTRSSRHGRYAAAGRRRRRPGRRVRPCRRATAGGAVAVADRVEQVEEAIRIAAPALERDGLHQPGCRVGVLATVLADARDVALDVARLERRPVERRGAAGGSAARRGGPDVPRPRRRLRGPGPAWPAPEITAQVCARRSIWHSSFVAEPSGVPSSK